MTWISYLVWRLAWAFDALVGWWRLGRWYNKRQRANDMICRRRGHVRDGSYFHPGMCVRCNTYPFMNAPTPGNYAEMHDRLVAAQVAAWKNLEGYPR